LAAPPASFFFLRLANTAHVPHLPPSWGTLYELTRLDDEAFEETRLRARAAQPSSAKRQFDTFHDAFDTFRDMGNMGGIPLTPAPFGCFLR
jgi:hypothetical protein